MAEKVASSRHENDNPRSKIYLQEREKKETLSLLESGAGSRRVRIKSSRARGKEGEEREREPAGGNRREKDETNCRQGEEGIKLRFNFAAISQARVARRDTPNIRRNLHFKLETSCDGSVGGSVVGADTDYKKRPAVARLRICTKNRGPRDYVAHDVTNIRISFVKLSQTS